MARKQAKKKTKIVVIAPSVPTHKALSQRALNFVEKLGSAITDKVRRKRIVASLSNKRAAATITTTLGLLLIAGLSLGQRAEERKLPIEKPNFATIPTHAPASTTSTAIQSRSVAKTRLSSSKKGKSFRGKTSKKAKKSSTKKARNKKASKKSGKKMALKKSTTRTAKAHK